MNTEENKREQGPNEDPGSETLDPVEEANNDSPAEQTSPEPLGEVPGTPDDQPADEWDTSEAEGQPLTDVLEATRRERDEYLDALRRLKAEFENSRKRQERELARILDSASERLMVELLPVLDNLDRALEAEGDIREGVRATRDQLADVLGKEGLLPVASDGQPFDPNVHEAVMGQPSDEHEDGTILQTFERGYVLNGKPIRPAKVVVAKQV